MKETLELMKRAAVKAGRHLVERPKGNNITTWRKHDWSLVTRWDLESERILKDMLSHTPYDILSEESGRKVSTERYFLVDPLDGTTNFSRNIPLWSVAVALVEDEDVLSAVTYDPLRDELYWGEKGKGAFSGKGANGPRLSREIKYPKIIGFDHGYGQESIRSMACIWGKVMQKYEYSRDFSATVLGLSYVATGRLQAFLADGDQPWDYAAGALLAREAGYDVKNFEGEDWKLSDSTIIAGEPEVVKSITDIIQDQP